MILQAKNINCCRGYRTLFTNVNFSLEPGRVLIVEGRNGSGKSTLLKVISGLRQPDSGQILWNRQTLEANSSDYKEQLVWLSHRNGTNDSLTAKENIQHSLALTNSADIKIHDYLERVGLKGYANTPVREFSAGMKRRLAITRLLTKQAKLWILDEPQSALDKAGISLSDELITKHVASGGMVVMASHHDVTFGSTPTEYLKL